MQSRRTTGRLEHDFCSEVSISKMKQAVEQKKVVPTIIHNRVIDQITELFRKTKGGLEL